MTRAPLSCYLCNCATTCRPHPGWSTVRLIHEADGMTADVPLCPCHLIPNDLPDDQAASLTRNLVRRALHKFLAQPEPDA